jgi:hypothetical protein
MIDNKLGIAQGQNAPYEFDINRRNLNSNELEYSDEEIDIKVKIRSKLNANYIKLIGMAKIKMTKLLSQ